MGKVEGVELLEAILKDGHERLQVDSIRIPKRAMVKDNGEYHTF